MKNREASIPTGDYLQTETVCRLLGLDENIPLTLEEMRLNLKVTFHLLNPISASLNKFFDSLRLGFEELDIQTFDFEETLDEEGKVKPGYAVFVAGMNDDAKDMMVNRVNSLYNNPIIGVYEGKSPVNSDDTNQDKLDSIITILAYDVVHVAIFMDKKSWSIGTMNGAIIQTPHSNNIKNAILECLIPKLTAQVIPPNLLVDISYRHNFFDASQAEYANILDDFSKAALLLNKHRLIMSHTKVSSLKFKNKFHERVIRAFLDQRSGMSYGFMVWQLPVKSKPAILADSENITQYYPDGNYIPISFLGKNYLVETPDVWVLSTRSGCDKTNLDIDKDIVRMGLSAGNIILDLPKGVESEQDVKPSYDTLAILAHALGNSIISSLQKAILGDNKFSQNLDNKGASLFHWHGELEEHQSLVKHFVHGTTNPSVSCSTPQSAVYSLMGKLQALEESILQNAEFLGDIHIEPHHGTNISSIKNLEEVVIFLKEYYPVA
jgi:hypothetical protein